MSKLIFSIDESAAKLLLLNKDELDEVDLTFSLNALKVLASRYLLRDADGKIIETPKQLFTRIAVLVGLADALHDTRIWSKHDKYDFKLFYFKDEIDSLAEKLETDQLRIGKYLLNRYHIEAMLRFFNDNHLNMIREPHEVIEMLRNNEFASFEINIDRYYQIMVDRDFLPNTPTIMNAGARLGQLSACFVLGIEDNLESIMQTAKDTAFIFKSGGGVGINYSNLRAENSMVASTSGVASGPVSFMGIVDKITDVIKQGGKRRGANMGILDASHGDIKKFITAKKTPGVLENFNVSVGLWDKPDKDKELFNLIAESAHSSAEPGVIFFDHVNKRNPLEKARGAKLTATNPCGEQSLYPFESCNLGSINLANCVIDGKFDWEKYKSLIMLCTKFLDNIVSMNKYPLDSIKQAGLETRRIGLGVMGLADALIKLDTRYDSPVAFERMSHLAEVLTYFSMLESVLLAQERGPFSLFKKSGYTDGIIPVEGAYQFNELGTYCDWKVLIEDITKHGIRNSYCTTVAPTGSLSMIADCSSGIEPTFALAFKKQVAVGDFYYKNPYLLDALGYDAPELWQDIANNHGSIQKLNVPQEVKDVFVTAFDIRWKEHIYAQGVWQKWINNAISKTINMPNETTVEDVKEAYRYAYDEGLKGLTVYRDGSRREQVLHA